MPGALLILGALLLGLVLFPDFALENAERPGCLSGLAQVSLSTEGSVPGR